VHQGTVLVVVTRVDASDPTRNEDFPLIDAGKTDLRSAVKRVLDAVSCDQAHR
jgi:hypothetical protein